MTWFMIDGHGGPERHSDLVHVWVTVCSLQEKQPADGPLAAASDAQQASVAGRFSLPLGYSGASAFSRTRSHA